MYPRHPDAYVGWNDIKGRKLSISDGSPDPYMRRCTDSQTLSGKYTTDDWVFNLISARQQQHYSRTFPSGSLIVNMPQRWNQDVQELRAATPAMRVPLIWCLGCTGRTPARS